MTVKRLLPVIALFRFNYIFGNDIQRHTHHDNLSNHSKIQKIIDTCEYVIVFSKAKPKKKRRCLFIVRCLRAPEKCCFGCLKEERNTRPIANPSQLKSFQHKVDVI